MASVAFKMPFAHTRAPAAAATGSLRICRVVTSPGNSSSHMDRASAHNIRLVPTSNNATAAEGSAASGCSATNGMDSPIANAWPTFMPMFVRAHTQSRS